MATQKKKATPVAKKPILKKAGAKKVAPAAKKSSAAKSSERHETCMEVDLSGTRTGAGAGGNIVRLPAGRSQARVSVARRNRALDRNQRL